MAVARAAGIAGLAAAIAGAGIIAGGTFLWQRSNDSASSGGEICLKRDLNIVEGATKRCYTPQDLAGLADAPVLDEAGRAATVNLSPPNDASSGMQVAHNCAEFRKAKADGWYALSTKDMRREASFTRACGVLSLLERARPAKSSFFEGNALTEADMKSLAEGPPFRFGPEFEMPPAPAAVVKTGGGWRLSSGGQSALVEEVAHADFNADGRGDMLVSVSLGVEGGTAIATEVGLLEKTSAAGPVRFVNRQGS